MNLKNIIRSIFGIRVDREIPPPGEMPPVGSSIVKDRIRIRLKFPINIEQWDWFSARGWRVVDMRNNRRRYKTVPDAVLVELLEADRPNRDELYRRFLNRKSSKNQASEEDAT